METATLLGGLDVGGERFRAHDGPAQMARKVRLHRLATRRHVTTTQTLDGTPKRLGIAGREQRTQATVVGERAKGRDVAHDGRHSEGQRLDERKGCDLAVTAEQEQVRAAVDL